jgi:hypothetical protein
MRHREGVSGHIPMREKRANVAARGKMARRPQSVAERSGRYKTYESECYLSPVEPLAGSLSFLVCE